MAKCRKRSNNDIELLESLPQPLNLNPIDNSWTTLDKNIRRTERINKETFCSTSEELRELIESMPRRLQIYK